MMTERLPRSAVAASGLSGLRRTEAETAEIELPLAAVVGCCASAQRAELMATSCRRPLFHGRSVGDIASLPQHCRACLRRLVALWIAHPMRQTRSYRFCMGVARNGL